MNSGENNHIYFIIFQGLEIEHCGGGVYEDISAYAQPDQAGAAWAQE